MMRAAILAWAQETVVFRYAQSRFSRIDRSTQSMQNRVCDTCDTNGQNFFEGSIAPDPRTVRLTTTGGQMGL